MAETALKSLPPNANSHMLLLFYSLLARLLRTLDQTGDTRLHNLSESQPFLAGYRDELRGYQPADLTTADAPQWWDQQIVKWEAAVDGHLPARALMSAARLNTDQMRILVAAGIVEEDIRFGGLYAALQEPVVSRRPSIGLLGWLLSTPDAAPLDGWLYCRPLLENGLLIAENQGDSRAEWTLRVPPAIWDALRGRPAAKPAPGMTRQPASSFPSLEHLILDAQIAQQVTRVPQLFASGQITALVLRGMGGSGRRTTLGALARAMGRDVLLYEGALSDDARKLLGPLATLTNALPIIRCNPNPGETVELPTLPCFDGPVGVTLGKSGGLRGELVANALSLHLPPPDAESRRRFWQAAPAHITPDDLNAIVEHFLLTGGMIARAAALAQTYAALDQRLSISAQDVQQATRALNRQTLDTLATPLEAISGWSDLVVGEQITTELRALESRCRRREALRQEAGQAFEHNLNRGVRALFSGASGTGKTLAARALAAALQMDLYRVDLAAVVNKYIGETERNLNEVFSRAEELDVILLLDEGDSLLTRRTDVSNANDRYANLETNYLLQRLETYEGIVIITTNAAQRIDSAFMRRLDVVVEFAKPDTDERRQLWSAHLPPAHDLSTPFLESVITRCTLTGGQIRNAALHATLLALNSGEALHDQHLEAALQREYRAAGASFPLTADTNGQSHLDRLRRFADELR
ncbi:MAG: ATP-binding protein [Anaerolineae bacterium]|nr:ATP-binding protein [Anaerolineae bacterium]